MGKTPDASSPGSSRFPLTGMPAFLMVWAGQLFSLLGSGMTWFALTFWVFQQTGRATDLAALMFAGVIAHLLSSPMAGALVDRWNRKLVMMLTDLGAGVCTVVMFVLFATGTLRVWNLAILIAISGAFGAFQFPAFSAGITMMLPKEQYARASGLQALAQWGSTIGAPIMAAALLGPIGVLGIMLIDIVTFAIGVGALLFVHVPQPEITEAGRKGQGTLLQESIYGFRYIWERKSLLGLQLVFFFINFLSSFAYTVQPAMILARNGNNELILGTVNSVAGAGGVAGSLGLSAWGGPKRKVHGVLIGMILSSLFGIMLYGLGRGVLVWSVAAFLGSFVNPVINGSSQAIWQSKVDPDVQGRVFAARAFIARISQPVAIALAGPLADYVFEPGMAPGGALKAFAPLVGSGPGTGMSLMFVLAGSIGVTVGVAGYIFRSIREVEEIIPDHDAKVAAPGTTGVPG